VGHAFPECDRVFPSNPAPRLGFQSLEFFESGGVENLTNRTAGKYSIANFISATSIDNLV
jgi:hypothetical protein